MEQRRSTRIRNIASAAKAAPAPVSLSTRKRKASGDEEVKTTTKAVMAEKAKVPVSSKEKPKINKNASSTNPPVNSDAAPDDKLSVLPAEILQLILENVRDNPSMVKLACTSKRYYSIASSIFHKRISVSVAFWAHIPNVIRRIEPHLSIAQKKQLKKEGKYKGQQEKFSTRLDPDAVPPSADFVRQMIVGHIDPGKKHKPIVMRYLEEVMKNLHNLEVFYAHEFTVSMSKSLAAQKNLKALNISTNMWRWGGGHIDDEAIISLAKISNLQHLCVTDRGWGETMVNGEKALSSLLLNSLSTLQTLEISADRNYSRFMENWEQDVKARHPDTWKQTPDFTSLRSFSLSDVNFNSCFPGNLTQHLTRAVDFLKLTELKLMNLGNGHLEFFKYLEDLFKNTGSADIHLRKLSLQMDGGDRDQNYAETEVHLEGLYRFISSFDTLICLEIHDYNTYNSAVESNPGLSRRLQQTILKHKDLEMLRFHYKGISSRFEVPCVPAATAKILVKNLPRLRVLEFAPSGDNKDEMFRVLSGAKNLEKLIFCWKQTLFPRPEWPKVYQDVVMKSVIQAFMENASCPGEFIWEKQYKLKEFRFYPFTYVIGSGLKQRNGWFQYDAVKVTKGDRTVMFQNLEEGKGASRDNWYYVPSSQWMDRIMKRNPRAQFMWDNYS
ncbi:hypothetical protein F53441_5689 [Fusarium austroafricanum]|uniref:F-box domain-containing protein n=1 Tax=Fusarium austroafricanum TaxID=2364996 RepID=A0A8H4KKA1_9HYPO|nr:hypothetical protein F53441_5689 [Fusarium austroafricanum]